MFQKIEPMTRPDRPVRPSPDLRDARVLGLFESCKAASKTPRNSKSFRKPAEKKPRKNFDSTRFYEIDRLGPIFLTWNMAVVKNYRGKIKEEKYQIKNEQVRWFIS